jgi:hypothetical protein
MDSKLTTLTDIEIKGSTFSDCNKMEMAGLDRGFLYFSPAVLRFAVIMEEKIQKCNKKQGKHDTWKEITQTQLFSLLEDEVKELKHALLSGENVEEEAADVANFAMFIALNEIIRK